MDEEKKEQVEKPIEKTFTGKVKELVETKIEKLDDRQDEMASKLSKLKDSYLEK